jgi:sphinganine-1-phosphate aldolase
MQIPEQGRSKDDILAELESMRGNDVRWQDGKTFGMIYDGGPSVHELVDAIAPLYVHENALNTLAFPSLGRMQSEVVSMVADMLHGPEGAAGFMTSGGTESILMAVKSARERGRKERDITAPEMIVPESAHAAFHKAAYYFGLKLHKVAVRDDWRADPDATADLVNENTVLLVGSAPAYPQGVIDPIPELAAIAADADANFHTDACMGGFVLPFMEMLGYDVKPWDFRVPGVTSISADLHKLGYVPKGASVIVHRSKALRAYQTFVFDGWLGGFYASPNMQGTRPGLPMALSWAVNTRERLVEGVRAVPGLTVLGEPEAHLVAITVAPGFEDTLDIFAVGDALVKRGWFHDRQAPPDSLHATVSAQNAPGIEQYLRDLQDCVDEVAGERLTDRSTNYATLE